MAKRKRKNDEYYFDVFLECGSITGDEFEQVMETHDYFIHLDIDEAISVTAESLDTNCRYTVGIYDPVNNPVDVKIVNPTATVHLKKAISAGEYMVRLRCETQLPGKYRLSVACNQGQSIWNKVKGFFTANPEQKKG